MNRLFISVPFLWTVFVCSLRPVSASSDTAAGVHDPPAGESVLPPPSPSPEILAPEWPEALPTVPPLEPLPPTPSGSLTPSPPPAPTPRPRIVCEGDRVRYLDSGKMIVGEGNIRISYGDIELTADRATVYVERKEAYAEGNVTLRRGNNLVTTDKLRYDFLKEKSYLAPGDGYYHPWYGHADEVSTEGKTRVDFTRGFATTCDLDEPHYRLQSGKFTIYPDDKIVAHNVTFYIGDVPFFWVPYYRRSIKDRCRGFFIYPGFKNSWGFFFLSGYHWCAPGLNTTLHLDYRYRRGWAYGFDGKFHLGESGVGEWQTYYMQDEGYEEGDEVVTEERYLTEFWYNHYFPYGISGSVSLHYFSDWSFRKDFFQNEYDADSQPSSYVFLNHRASDYTISLQALARLNEFYEVNEKIPEAEFQVKEIQIGESDFYYQGDNTFTSYRKKLAGVSSTEYHTDRFDTFHGLSYSKKLFGWLVLYPAVSLRETYYSRGPGEIEESDSSGDGTEPTPTPEPTPEPGERKDFWRRVFSASMGVSTSIYGIFPAENKWLKIHKLRHVVEPSINYYFTDRPTVLPDEIYQFDWIDEIERTNFTRFGLRNLLQTKHLTNKQESSWTLIDLILQTDMFSDPERDNGDRLFGPLSADLEITPFEWSKLDLEMSYDYYDEKVDEETLDLWIAPSESVWLSLSHNFVRSRNRDRLSSEFYVRINPKWAFKIYGRYDLELDEFEEESLTVYRDLHCWDSMIRFRHHEADDEFEVYLAFWIKAFPRAPLFLSN